MKPSDGQNDIDSIIAQGDRGYLLQPYDLPLHSEGKREGKVSEEVTVGGGVHGEKVRPWGRIDTQKSASAARQQPTPPL